MKNSVNISSLFTRLSMKHKVVLDCDCFVLRGTPYLKTLAYAAPSLGRFGDFDFTLPSSRSQYRKDLQRQARHSHGLLWSTVGSYHSDLIPRALVDLFDKLGKRPVALCFYAKGFQKCQLLEQWLPRVTNLDDLGCPTYANLSTLMKTALVKAVTFALWLLNCE